MGLLDDAIREHLELKRQRGADPGEIAQAERDALGPARRGPEPLDAPAAVADAPDGELFDEEAPVAAPDPAGYAEPPEPDFEFDVRPAEPEPEPVAYEPPPEPPYEPAIPQPEAAPAPPPPVAEEPEPPTAAPGELAWEAEPIAEADEDPGQATVAFDPEEVAAAQGRAAEPAPVDPPPVQVPEAAAPPARVEPEAPPAPAAAEPVAADHDPLEDTPDFLEDTPEHDRLWFEQRPPRDFDFDS